MLLTIIVFIIVFGLLVLVHEFGHYFFAKRAGILVREFAIGMGPKLWWRQVNGTTYTIRCLPLGGYVRLAGSEEDEEDLRVGMPVTLELNEAGQVVKINTSQQPGLFTGLPLQVTAFDLVDTLTIKGYVNGDETTEQTYAVDHDAELVEKGGTTVRIAPRDTWVNSAPLPARMMTNFAGAFNNFLLSLVAFVVLGFTLAGIPTNSNQLGQVAAGSPAARAGLVAGDRIVAVNGHPTKDWEALATQIANHPGQKVTLQYRHQGKLKTTTATPKKVQQGKQTVGQIGISERLEHSIAARLNYGWHQFIAAGTLIFTILGHMVTHGFSLNDLGGPVAIYAGTSQATALGFNGVLNFLALLSINLGIVNLLPIPALDGGKLLLNIIEAIIRRPIPEKAEAIVSMAGFFFLLLLMILVTFNDIQRYFIH